MDCPKCGSNEVKDLAGNYPNSYECKSCGHMFLKGKQALIDE